MLNFFSKFLGKVALLAAAVLWAGCNDSDKKAGDTVAQKGIREEQQQVQEPPTKAFVGSAKKVKSKYLPVRDSSITSETISGVTALYGVLRPYEIFTPDEPRKIHQSRPIPRCLVKELTEEDVVAGKDNDIDVEYFLKVCRQRLPGFRHICNKALYGMESRTARTNKFNAKIVLTLQIAPSGKVENVEIISTTIEENSGFSAINEGVKKAVRRWVFPKTQNGGTWTFTISLYEVLPSAASSASEEPLSPTK